MFPLMTLIEDPAIREYLRRMVQDDGLKILEAMPLGEITDEKLAEKSGANLYLVRKTLYTLYEKRLAEYRRERNDENGWLTYLWKMNWRDLEAHLGTEVDRLRRSLETRITFETENTFYLCAGDGARLMFDAASQAGFLCPQCGAPLQQQDNSPLVQAMEKRLGSLGGAPTH